MFKGIFFSLWIACAMTADENSVAGQNLVQIDALIPVIGQPTFPTAAAQCSPIILGAGQWVHVDSQEHQFENGNQRQVFTFTIMDTPVTQFNIVVEVNRRRTAAGRPPITQDFLTHLASYLQDSPVTSVRLREEWTQNGQVVDSLMDPPMEIQGQFLDMHGKVLKLEFGLTKFRSFRAFLLAVTKPQGFNYQITLEELGNAILKFTRVAFSEARLKSVEEALTQSDSVSRLGIFLPRDPITGQPQNAVNIRWTTNTGGVEFWGAEDFPWGHFEDSGDHKKLNGFVTDDQKNLLDVELILHWRSNPWTFEMNISRNSEGKVKDAASKLHEIVFSLGSERARPEVLKAIVEKVYQAPIGQVNKFTLTESDLEGQQRRLI